MLQKVGRILIGVLAGGVLIAIAGYIITGLSTDTSSVDRIPMIKDNLLASETINEVQERESTIKFPITVSNNEIGVKNPF